VASRTFVENTNISPGLISALLFAQLSGWSGITAEWEGCPVIGIKDIMPGGRRKELLLLFVCSQSAELVASCLGDFSCVRTLKTNNLYLSFS
jgi:hypothetical protein